MLLTYYKRKKTPLHSKPLPRFRLLFQETCRNLKVRLNINGKQQGSGARPE